MTINVPATVVVLVILIHIWYWRRERRLTALSRARLDLTRSVIEMEQLMLAGELTHGDICHDKFYKIMAYCQHADRLRKNWRLWQGSAPMMTELRDRMVKEINARTPLGGVIEHFARASYNMYRQRSPNAALCFTLWTVMFREFLLMLICVVKFILAFILMIRKVSDGVRAIRDAFNDIMDGYTSPLEPLKISIALWFVAISASKASEPEPQHGAWYGKWVTGTTVNQA